jgi:monofunctional biosynthetic peptidoglycan transglycosylase
LAGGEAGELVEDEPATSEPFIDFSETDSTRWYVVNDGVMGGLSKSGIKRTDEATGLFTGVLSLENNGGFASVRADVGLRDLSAYDGLEIRVRGDGRTYQLRIRTSERFDGVAYRAYFETSDEEWVTTRLSFDEFLPTFRGRILSDVPPLDSTRIRQVSFMLADKNPGGFFVEIDFVRPWLSADVER